MMKKILLAYNNSSNGAKLLKQGLSMKFVRKSSHRPLRNKIVINWGKSSYPNREFRNCKVVNKPESVRKASNKLSTMISLDGKGITPPWTENRSEAVLWLSEGCPVVCRTILNGHSGDGIVIAKTEEEIVEAPLYTKYIKKTREVRVHVQKGICVLVQEKKRNRDIPDEEVNWQIRNHQNGFIYAKNVEPVGVQGLRSAIISVRTLGLDFGAVDLIYNKRENKWYVLEVNTAPGLSEATINYYIKYINNNI